MWHHMHHLLREPFLPSNYIKTLFREYNNCHQGAKTTKEYALEFQRLMEQNNLHETKVQIVYAPKEKIKLGCNRYIHCKMPFD